MRGFQFGLDYEDTTQRAEAIFAFARDRVRTTSRTVRSSVSESSPRTQMNCWLSWTRMVLRMETARITRCCSARCTRARLSLCVVLTPDHAAALVYLPDYSSGKPIPHRRRGIRLGLGGGNRGEQSPGLDARDYMGTRLLARELRRHGVSTGSATGQGGNAVPRHTSGDFALPISPFFLVLLVLWLVSNVGRRRSASRW